MSTTHTVRVSRPQVDAEKLGYFRFGALSGGVVLTTDAGAWHHLTTDAFHAFLRGTVAPGDADYDALASKGFLRSEMSLDAMAADVRKRKRFVGLGPTSHTLHLRGPGGKLTVETAKDILDLVMLSTAASLDVRLVSGPGEHDADLLAFIVQYGTEKNRYEGKALTWNLVSDLAGLPEGAAGWLVDKRFVVRTPFDGPAELHDAQRGYTRAAPHAQVAAAIARLHEAAQPKHKGEWRVRAEVHVGAANVGHPAAVVDALAAAGIRRFKLRPILTGDGAVTAAAFAAFYRGMLDALAARRASGEAIVEETTATLLARILTGEAGDDVERRSPCSHGHGQLVYDAAGHIFPCDLARRLHEQGEEMFLLGKAGVLSYKDCMSHATLRTLALASMLESLPGFTDHWTTPYCGADPVAAYAATGDLFPRLAASADARVEIGMVEALFERLIAGQAMDAWAS